MGNVQANLTNQTLASYTEVVNSLVNQVYNQAVNECSSGNNMTLDFGIGCVLEIVDGEVNVTQVAGTNCNFQSSNVVNTSANFTNQLKTLTQNFIEQNAKSEQGWFAVAFSLGINGASSATEVTNLISNYFTNNVTTGCTAVSNALNNAQIRLCGRFRGTTFNFNQNALVVAITSCVNEVVTKAFTDNTVLNELLTETEQKLTSKQEGLSSIFWIILVIGVVIIAGLIIFLLIRRVTASPQPGPTIIAAPPSLPPPTQ